MKKIIVFILNFLLIILICASCTLIILSKTILSKNYVIESLQKTNFYNELNSSIQNDINNYLAQVGIPNGTLNNLYTLEDLENSVEATLDSIYYNKPIQSDIDITNKINSMLHSFKIPQEITNKIAKVYERKVSISPKYINMIGEKLTKVLPIINTTTFIILIATIIVLAIIIIILHNTKESINTIGIAVFTSGILGIIFKILIGNKFDNIFLLNDAFSSAMAYIINDIIGIISFAGIIMSIVGILLIISHVIFKEDYMKE